MFYSVFALVLAQERRVKQGVLVTTYNFCLLLSLALLPFASTHHAHWLYFENFLSGLLCISDNLWLEYLHLNVKFNQHLLSLRCGLIIRLIWYIHLKHPVLKSSPSSYSGIFSCICILCPRREIPANVRHVVSPILESASLLRTRTFLIHF